MNKPPAQAGDNEEMTMALCARDIMVKDVFSVTPCMSLVDMDSHFLQRGISGAPVVEVAWQGFTDLGLWMKPGAEFLCIEPWAGFADPVGYTGDFFEKPGILLLAPGERRSFTHRITIEPPAPAR